MTAASDWTATRTWAELSAHQRDLIIRIARGQSNQTIAADLDISLSDVRDRIAALYEQFGFTNRVQVVLWVMTQEDIAAKVIVCV